MLPASFRNAHFFVEANTTSGGRRIVEHEFPKKDAPYAEDMGRRAKQFSIRAYCIAYPADTTGALWPLFTRDYRLARDILQAVLDDGQYGALQLPFGESPYAPQATSSIVVACEQYRLTEEERFGGYCTFDISFVEAGALPNTAYTNTTQNVISAYNAAIAAAQAQIANGTWNDESTDLPPQIPQSLRQIGTFAKYPQPQRQNTHVQARR
jgi:hypothetical protein